MITYSKNKIPALTILFSLILILVPLEIYGDGEFPISIVDQKIFKSLNGNWNLIGVVQNKADVPLEVKIGVNITKPNSVSSILTSTTFGNIIQPYLAAPFKFTIDSDESFNGLAYPIKTKKVLKPLFRELIQNYSNFPTDDEKAIVGIIKNKGNNIIRNVAVYASVHSFNGTQIDSVKSNVFPVIFPGEEVSYKITPDDAIKHDVYFYSCAGLDINAPISTLRIDKGEYLVYNLESASAISNFRYQNLTDSVIFEIKPYNPLGGYTIFQIPQTSPSQKIDVYLDGEQYVNKIITRDGKTINMKIFIPKDKHELKISGVRNPI